MALPRFGEALALEDVPQVAVARRTDDLDSVGAVILDLVDDRALVALVEGRPSTAGVKLGLERVYRCAALATREIALGRVELVVLARAGRCAPGGCESWV